jgi:hypothetical protein
VPETEITVEFRMSPLLSDSERQREFDKKREVKDRELALTVLTYMTKWKRVNVYDDGWRAAERRLSDYHHFYRTVIVEDLNG